MLVYITSLLLTFIQYIIAVEVSNLYLKKADNYPVGKYIFMFIIIIQHTVLYFLDLGSINVVLTHIIFMAVLIFLYTGELRDRIKAFILSFILIDFISTLLILILSSVIGNPFINSKNEDTFFLLLNILANIIIYIFISYRALKLRTETSTNFSFLKYILFLVALNIAILFIFTRYLLRHNQSSNDFEQLTLFVFAGTTVFTVIMVLLMQAIQKHIQEQYETQLKLTMYETQYEFYDQMNTTLTDLRRLRHDMKNHNTAVLGYLDKGLVDDARDYLRKLAPTYSSTDLVLVPDSILLSSILSKHKARCDENNIPFTYHITLTKIEVSAPDLAVIIGNILDNAFESSLKDKPEDAFIHMEITSKENCIYILCRNHYTEALTRLKGLFKTSKKDSVNHGLGLQNVQDVVESLEGSMDIRTAKNIFEIFLYIRNVMNKKK